MNNKYVKHFRCKHCGIWIPKKEAIFNRNKQPTCPKCRRRLKQQSRQPLLDQTRHFHQPILTIPKYETWVKI